MSAFKSLIQKVKSEIREVNFGTAFFVALLTAGMSSFMATYSAQNAGATEAAALSYALAMLSWIGLAITLLTYFVSTKLPKPAENQAVQQPVMPAGK